VYDNLIRGKGERIVVMADARQQKFDGSEARQDPGESVVLTLDERSSTSRSANWQRLSRKFTRPPAA